MTNVKNQEIAVVLSKEFYQVLCEFYKGSNEFYLTRKQVGEALEYADPQKAIDKIHTRNADRLDNFSVTTNLVATDGKTYSTIVYTLKGVMEICRFSRQPKADEFMDFVWNVMESLFKGEYKLVKNETHKPSSSNNNALYHITEAQKELAIDLGEFKEEARGNILELAYDLDSVKKDVSILKSVPQILTQNNVDDETIDKLEHEVDRMGNQVQRIDVRVCRLESNDRRLHSLLEQYANGSEIDRKVASILLLSDKDYRAWVKSTITKIAQTRQVQTARVYKEFYAELENYNRYTKDDMKKYHKALKEDNGYLYRRPAKWGESHGAKYISNMFDVVTLSHLEGDYFLKDAFTRIIVSHLM